MSTGDIPRRPAAPPNGNTEPPPSPPPDDPPPGPADATVRAILDRRQEEHALSRRTAELARERDLLWEELLLVPVTPIRADWYAAWREVAAAAHRGDPDAAVAALVRAADVFRRLREAVGVWRNAAQEWRDRARPVDTADLGFGNLVPFRPANDTDLGYWALLFGRENMAATIPPGRCRYDGPGVIPGHMGRQVTDTHPDAESGVHLLVLLAHAATADDLAEFVRISGVGWFRGLTAALAAVILPPDAGVRFAAGELPADDDQRENARFLLGAAQIGLGGDYLACTRPLILGEAAANEAPADARAKLPPAVVEPPGGCGPVTVPAKGQEPRPRGSSADARRRQALYECIRALHHGGMKETGIVTHLSTPEGKDLLGEVRWELEQRPNTRGSPSRARVLADVVAAALRGLY